MAGVLLSLLGALVGVIRWVVDQASDLLFPLYWGKSTSLPPLRSAILTTSATSLADKIARGEVTSHQVVETFIQRIKDVNPIINAMVDARFSEALEEADRVDRELAGMGGEERRERCRSQPFLGVPFTTKDCFPVTGLSWTAGLLARKGVQAPHDSPTVAAIRRAGGIPLAVTNVSELCMWMESANAVYGRSCNPYHTGRTVGGSSGGEGALIGAAGSPCGIGSDVGGSIRMPAFFNGIFGHKPSSGIVDNGGGIPLAHGAIESYLCTGPMARHATDLLPMLQVLAEDKAPLLSLQTKVDLDRTKVYWLEDDGGFPAITPVHSELRRSQRRLLELLRAAHTGMEVQQAPGLGDLYYSLPIWAAAMSDEPLAPSFAAELASTGLQLEEHHGEINTFWELAKWCVGCSPHTLPALGLALIEKTTDRETAHHKDALRRGLALKAAMEELLGKDGVLLYPSHPTPAPYHGQPLTRPFNFAYTGVFNILGLPVTQVPLGISSMGVPLGIQVVGGRHQDRVCLAVAREAERLMGGWVPPSTLA